MTNHQNTYDVVKTVDGDVLSLDLHGHLTDADLEAFLWEVERDPDHYGLGQDEPQPRAFAVEHTWRWDRPVDPDVDDEEECDGFAWIYEYGEGASNDDAVPVTRLHVDSWGWGAPTCAYHPDRASTSGLPAYLWPEDGAERATMRQSHTALWVCQACADRLHERHRILTTIWGETMSRIQAHGAGIQQTVWHDREAVTA